MYHIHVINKLVDSLWSPKLSLYPVVFQSLYMETTLFSVRLFDLELERARSSLEHSLNHKDVKLDKMKNV